MRFQSIYKPLQSAYAEIRSNNRFRPFYDVGISRNVGWEIIDFTSQEKESFNFNTYPFFFNRDFSIASMTDAEINYLNSLIVEYKSPFTTRERRNEIWVALNVAPTSLQIQNSAIKSLQDTGTLKIDENESSMGLKTIPGKYVFRATNVKNAIRQPGDPGESIDEVREYDYDDIVINEGRLNDKLWGNDPDKRFLRPFMIPTNPNLNNNYNRIFLKRFGYMQPAIFSNLLEKDNIVDSTQNIEKLPPVYTDKNGDLIVGNLDPLLSDLISLNGDLKINGAIYNPVENDPDAFIGIGSGKEIFGFLDNPVRAFSFALPPISDQELVFYIRYKYGIAFTADETDGNVAPTLYSIPFVNDEPDVPAAIGQSSYDNKNEDYSGRTITQWIAENATDLQPLESRIGNVVGLLYRLGRLLRVFLIRGLRPGSKFMNPYPKQWWKSNHGLHGLAIRKAVEGIINAGAFAKYNILDNYVSWVKQKEFENIYTEDGDEIAILQPTEEGDYTSYNNLSFMKISFDHASFDFRRDTSSNSVLPSDWKNGRRLVPQSERAPNATQNQSLPFSQVRAYWRALQIIRENERWSLEVSTGVQTGDVLMVAGKIRNEAVRSEEFNPIFISGKKSPDTIFHERPWRHLFNDGEYTSDRVIESSNQCFISEQQYMRNIIVPQNLWAFIETHDENYPEENWLFTEEQIGKTIYALSESLPYKSIFIRLFTTDPRGNLPDNFSIGSKLSESVILNLKIKSIISATDQKDLGNLILYNNKDAVTLIGLFAITTVEILNTVTHHGKNPINFPGFRNLGHHFFHDLFVILETFITGYKVGANINKGKPANYVFLSLNVIGFILGFLAGRDRGLTVPGFGTVKGHKWAFLFYIGLVLAEKIYYGLEEKEAQEKYIALINEATDKNVLEGPYLQSEGKIEIPKNIDGTLPVSLELDSNGNITNVKSEPIERPTISYSISEGITNSNTLTSELVDINASFLNPESIDKLGKRFFSQVTKEECRELIKIAGQLKNQKSIYTTNGGETPRYNEVLNYAPNYFDVFKYVGRESFTIPSPFVKFKGIEKGIIKAGLDFGSYDKYDLRMNQDIVWGDMYGLVDSTERKFIELWEKYIKEYDPMYEDYPYNAKLQKMFKYNRYPIDTTTELSSLLNGEAIPTEPYYRYNRWELVGNRNIVELSNGPILGNYYQTKRSSDTILSSRNKISDKEKVNLIRRKYGLDAVIPYAIKDGKIDERDPTNGESNRSNFCCDEPKLSLDPLPKCLYVFDFASEAFINELKKSPQCDCDD